MVQEYKQVTIEDELFNSERLIQIFGEITETSSVAIANRIRYLASKSTQPIILEIFSPGGSCDGGKLILSEIKRSKAPIYGVARSEIASMATVIFSACDKRYVESDCHCMIHQSSGGVSGNIQDARTTYERWQHLNDELLEVISKNTKHSVEEMRALTQHDLWLLSGEDAIKFGLADELYDFETAPKVEGVF